MTDPAPGEPAPLPPEPRSPFGLFRFTIDGRRAPALFVGGWLATLIGSGLVAIGLVASANVVTATLLLLGLGLLTVGLILLGGSQAIERQAAGEPYGGPAPILLLVAAVTATLFAAAIVGIALEAAGVRLAAADRPLGDLLSVALQALVFVGMVRLMVVGTGALSWADMGFTLDRRRAVSGLVSGAVLAVPVIAITSLVAAVVVPLVGQTPQAPLPPTGSGAGLALHLLAGAVVGPLAEETLFRGAMLTAWLRTVGPNAAITRTAILFALTHVLQVGGDNFGQAAGLALVAAIARLPVAFALGWVYTRTRTIWAPLGLHAVFNAILITLGELSQATI